MSVADTLSERTMITLHRRHLDAYRVLFEEHEEDRGVARGCRVLVTVSENLGGALQLLLRCVRCVTVQ